MKLRIHKALVDAMDLKKTNMSTQDAKQRAVLRERTQKAIFDILNAEDASGLLSTRELKGQMVKEVLDEALGLGPHLKMTWGMVLGYPLEDSKAGGQRPRIKFEKFFSPEPGEGD